jgi:hypothetical protein
MGPNESAAAIGRRDKRVIQCNFREATSECRAGARAYLTSTGHGDNRVRVLARSRSGRWIRKWENLRRLTAFRFKTIPPEHTLYARLDETSIADEGLRHLNDDSAKPVGGD